MSVFQKRSRPTKQCARFCTFFFVLIPACGIRDVNQSAFGSSTSLTILRFRTSVTPFTRVSKGGRGDRLSTVVTNNMCRCRRKR